MFICACVKYNETKIEHFCCKHRESGGGVILHPPVTVRLFHQTNLEDNMAEILIFSPSDATFLFKETRHIRRFGA